MGYLLAFVVIAFLVLALIDAYDPFPQGIIKFGEILAIVILWPLLFYCAYLDFKAYKAAGRASA